MTSEESDLARPAGMPAKFRPRIVLSVVVDKVSVAGHRDTRSFDLVVDNWKRQSLKPAGRIRRGLYASARQAAAGR
jgi:hypothetical protein